MRAMPLLASLLSALFSATVSPISDAAGEIGEQPVQQTTHPADIGNGQGPANDAHPAANFRRSPAHLTVVFGQSGKVDAGGLPVPPLEATLGPAPLHEVQSAQKKKPDPKTGEHEPNRSVDLPRGQTWESGALTLFISVASLLVAGFAGIASWNAARAARSSACSAKKTLAHIVDASRAELRAYIGVESAQMRFPTPAAPVAEGVIKNFGQTPAHDVRQWVHLWIEAYPLTIDLPLPPPDFVMGQSVLAPGAHTSMFMPKEPPVRPEEIRELGTATGTIWVYGEVTYRDVFGERHRTRYRLFYGGSEGVRDGRLKPDQEGNDAT